MTNPPIPAKSFIKAMTLPDNERRKMLEKLGARMMDQIRTDRNSLHRTALGAKLSAKNA